jgi:hypothetical protein
MQHETAEACPPGDSRWKASWLSIQLEKLLRPRNDPYIAMLVNLAAAATFMRVNEQIRWFPSWLPFVIAMLFEAGLIVTHLRKWTTANQTLGYLLVMTLFFFVFFTVWNLVQKLPQHKEIHGSELLSSGAMLWLANVLVFTIWYWRFDGSGPHLRDAECPHVSFVFPQIALNRREKMQLQQQDWKPGVIDYLFLAFNTSTALSPADTAVVGRGAKITTMLQSLISLAIVVVVIGRGVNAM